MHDENLDMLESDSWFSGIAPGRRALLLREARTERLANGARIYGPGDPPNGLWAVLHGQVRLKSLSANGGELLALIVRPGTWFGELSTLDGHPRPHDAIAFGPTSLLHIAMPAFGRAATADPELYRDLGLLVCAHQRTALRFITQSIGQSIRARLAQALIRASSAGEGGVNIRQEELAAVVGIARQTLNRHLKRFERDRLVAISYAQIRILDPAGLQGIALE
ncbi:Crp/Fnr family transcriptional regulator [Sphingomonas sp. OK281]|uniref:Crp/Fnr family transcriptional regulator n=1 Tax=Sphingomonas sp. OK281 TaxID=1881067 RepID=UPI0008DEEBFB|nr:Crp/Fnr family transcriptional regulator [Sphingomonas sp. OK281]SFO04651.1 transcriptional regulator, Crp/Fnr family [Sphingomonas sp. OK281]